MIIDYGVKPLKVTLNDYDSNSQTLAYSIEHTPICCYDQHSRARIGVKFINYEVIDEPRYIVYTHVWNMMEKNPSFKKKVEKSLKKLEKVRQNTKGNKDNFNLMTRSCSYYVEQTFGSLRGQMARRLKFCEEEFIVGLHWKLRNLIIQRDKTFGQSLLPGCDRIESCDYSKADYLSNMFGCLFASCGRWPAGTEWATFNESCSTPEMLEEQLNIIIPRSAHDNA